MKVVTEELKYVDLFPEEAGKLAQRLHTKKDEIPFIRKSFIADKDRTEVNKKERSVISYISTTAKDRDNEQLLPEGVVTDNYTKNPIVLWGHDYKSVPIGKNLWIKKDEKGLIAKTVFAKSEKADDLFKAYTEDIEGTGPLLAAWSVGFIPLEFEDVEKKDTDDKDLPDRIYKKWELLEYSAVPIPSCPEALTLAVEKNLIPDGLKKALELGGETEDFQEDEEIMIDEETEIKVDDEDTVVAAADGTIQEVSLDEIDSPDGETEEKSEGEEIELQDAVNEIVADDVDIESLHVDGEATDFIEAEVDGIDPIADYLRDIKIEISELKEGRVLSQKNRTLVKETIDTIRNLVEKLEELYSATDPNPREEEREIEIELIEEKEPVVDGDKVKDALDKVLNSGLLEKKIKESVDLSVRKLKGKIE